MFDHLLSVSEEREIYQEYFWSLAENLKYKDFLVSNFEFFGVDSKERRQIQIHVQMGKFIGSRNSKQCRSHHQKMLRKYGSIEGIIAYIDSLDLGKMA
jgi:hypothetical protein